MSPFDSLSQLREYQLVFLSWRLFAIDKSTSLDFVLILALQYDIFSKYYRAKLTFSDILKLEKTRYNDLSWLSPRMIQLAIAITAPSF